MGVVCCIQGQFPVAFCNQVPGISEIAQRLKRCLRAGRISCVQRPAGCLEMKPGRAVEKRAGSQGDCGNSSSQDSEAGTAAGFLPQVFRFTDPLQADCVFPHIPAVQVQLAFFHADLCFHRFRTEAGKNHIPVPAAAGTEHLFLRIGPAAYADPQTVLFAWIADSCFAGGKFQVGQGRTDGQGVGDIFHSIGRVPAPGFIVRVPYFFHCCFQGTKIF